jgi:AbrB family looped-hinge helix DNA binding protein
VVISIYGVVYGNGGEKMFTLSRKLDELGRVVIPAEMRQKLGWKERDDILMSVKDDSIILTKMSYAFT